MAKIGYVRVSTEEQNPARQEEILKEAGCVKIFVDKMSGKDTNRPELQKMLEYVREGDVLYVESISRLARSTRDLLNLVEQLQAKDVAFESQKEKIDTSTPQGKFMLTVFAAMADLEREQIRQRQAEGIAIAKAKGKYRGKAPVEYDKILFEELYKQWKDGKITQKYMCEKLGMCKATLYKKIRAYEVQKGIRPASAKKRKKQKA